MIIVEENDKDMETKRSSNNVLVWVAGGLLAIFLFGSMTMLLVGALIFARSQQMAASPTTSIVTSPAGGAATMTAVEAQPAAPAPPRVIIATPEGGIDYENAALANVYREVNPSVVNISVLADKDSVELEGFTPSWLDDDDLIVVSGGSGFVWDEAGYIVTNNHVVDGAELLHVTFSDGATAVGEVVGVDVDSDLAVVKIDPEGFQLIPVQRGVMEDVYVGMRVVAIGNPFGLEGTVTSGIVSALGRSIPARDSFSIPGSIQTDAAINPGNSGGPLLNERGELIGVNAQIRSEVRSNSGVGFAIPVSIVERVAPALIKDGAYEHAYIGVSGRTVSPICAEALDLPKTARGALVLQVLNRTPAARAGLHGSEREVDSQFPGICPSVGGGDLVTAIDGRPVTRFDDVLTYLESFTAPGDTVRLTVLRDQEVKEIDVTLSARPQR